MSGDAAMLLTEAKEVVGKDDDFDTVLRQHSTLDPTSAEVRVACDKRAFGAPAPPGNLVVGEVALAMPLRRIARQAAHMDDGMPHTREGVSHLITQLRVKAKPGGFTRLL